MKVIDKVRLYLKSISKTKEHYEKMLDAIWINPQYRNQECAKPYSCAECPKNNFIRRN